MSPAFILDCSLVMSWCFSDEATRATNDVQDRMADEAALVPWHWFLEVANVLAMAEKRKRIHATDSTQFLAFLNALDIQPDSIPPASAFDRLLPLCRTHGLTTYDAAYLDLAQRSRLPLATLDVDLRKAATKLGVELLGK